MSNLAQISNRLRLALMLAGFILMLVGPVGAQNGELRLSLSKDWGFAAGGQIQGVFTLSVRGPQEVAAVRFELDGQEIAAVTQPPFTLKFNTDKYPSGKHSFSATGRMADGRTIESNAINVEFVTAEAGWQVVQRIMLPLFVVVGAIVLLVAVGPLIGDGKGQRRSEPGAPRHYGPAGGAICPQCGRPFALSFLSLNLITRKLERCPHCGKWSLVTRAPREALAAAEAAEVEASHLAMPEARSEKWIKRIEESRYQ
jgi:hypothetical protein